MPIINISNFLRVGDVKENEVLLITTAPEEKDFDFSPAKDGSGLKRVVQGRVRLSDGTEKVLTYNKTSLKALIDAWGNNTDNWIGKKIRVKFVEQITFGKLKKILILLPEE